MTRDELIGRLVAQREARDDAWGRSWNRPLTKMEAKRRHESTVAKVTAIVDEVWAGMNPRRAK